MIFFADKNGDVVKVMPGSVHQGSANADEICLFAPFPKNIRVTAAFPEFAEYYREIADLRENPKELIGMFGRTLAEMDRDEYFGMMEQLREDVKNLSEQTQRLRKEKESLEWEKLSVEKANRSLADEKQSLEEQIGRLLEQRKRMTGRL